ncbi:MAG: hypothetical protein M3Q65_05220 [Chloroflexota bacterium]|nr:hypothetical protein [Chloroflexota bacterium]
MSVPVSAARLRQSMFEHGASVREVARAGRTSAMAVGTMLRTGQASDSLTVAQLSGVAEGAGLTLGELLTPGAAAHPVQDGDAAGADAARLGRLLAEQDRLVLHDDLCAVLGWTRDRLTAAIVLLHARLVPAGLGVHDVQAGVGIRPVDPSEAESARALAQRRTGRHGLDYASARLLHLADAGQLSKRELPKSQQPRLAALDRLGMVRIAAEDSWVGLSPETAYALDFER